ncbi:hypothetical protein ACWEP8_37000 [Streptomyces hydrogenans]
MTSSATEIRTAAEKLRALATAATHEDRTRWETGHTLGSKSPVVVDNHERPTVLIETWAAHREQVDAYLTAFASPVVGLAVAGWLDHAADTLDGDTYHDISEHPDDDPDEGPQCVDDCGACQDEQAALAVARAILAPAVGQEDDTAARTKEN